MWVTSITPPSCTPLSQEFLSASMPLPTSAKPLAARLIPAQPWQVPVPCTPQHHPPHRLLAASNEEAALSALGRSCDTPGKFLAMVNLALTAAVSTTAIVCTAGNICTSFILLC